MILKKLKKKLLIMSAIAVMSFGGINVMAEEISTVEVAADVEGEVTDEAEVIEASDTSVGIHNGKIALNEKNFPDKYFRQYLADEHDDDDDGYLNVEDAYFISIWGYTHAGAPYKDLKSLKGIEYLTELKIVELIYTQVETMDLSKNTKLYELSFRDNSNYKGDIDLSNCPVTFVVVENPIDYKLILSNNSEKIIDTIYLEVDEVEGEMNLNNIVGYDFDIITDSQFNKTTKKYSYTIDDINENCNVVVETKDSANARLLGFFNDKNIVSYNTHVQSYGWQGYVSNGKMSGTSGEAKRLEAISIQLKGFDTRDIGVQYSTHCQTYGWMPWSCDGEINGTSGEAKRLEAIKIQLTGEDAKYYDIYYRVHAQSYGWLGWAKNGEPAGTAGYGKRLEGIQIVIKYKNDTAPELNYAGVDGSTSKYSNQAYVDKNNAEIVIPGDVNAPIVSYKTHVQSFGWQKWVHNGAMSGTEGKAKRLEGINIKVTNCPYEGDIVYTTHIQKYGWKDGKPEDTTRASWKKNGEMSGTSGEAKRLEAICIDLTGEMGEKYDVYYRVHAQSFGWLGWAKNGEPSGTAGYAKRLEGIQIVLVPVGGEAPAKDFGGITSVDSRAYVEK